MHLYIVGKKIKHNISSDGKNIDTIYYLLYENVNEAYYHAFHWQTQDEVIDRLKKHPWDFENVELINEGKKTCNLKNKYWSFDKFDYVAKHSLCKELFTVIGGFEKEGKKYYHVASSKERNTVIPRKKLVELISQNLVVNAKVSSNKGKYYISGINWCIPVLKELSKSQEKRILDLIENDLALIDFRTICEECCENTKEEIVTFYSGKQLSSYSPETRYSPADPADFDTPDWDDFENAYVEKCFEYFVYECERLMRLNFYLDDYVMTDTIKNAFKEAVRKESTEHYIIKWGMDYFQLGVELGLLDSRVLMSEEELRRYYDDNY